jgi:serine/threonine-protein kinase RsbW
MRRVQLVIDSELADVSLVAVAVNGICVHSGFDHIGASQIELCTAEAITNAIRHAYHGQRGLTVSVVVSVYTNHIQVDVCDNGKPMSSDQIERFVGGTEVAEVGRVNLASIPEGGRGLQIMRDLMDTVAYIREGDVNRLQMTKKFPIIGVD